MIFGPKPPPIRPRIEFSVKDSSQQYIGVSSEDVDVLEDGVEQVVALDAELAPDAGAEPQLARKRLLVGQLAARVDLGDLVAGVRDPVGI